MRYPCVVILAQPVQQIRGAIDGGCGQADRIKIDGPNNIQAILPQVVGVAFPPSGSSPF